MMESEEELFIVKVPWWTKRSRLETRLKIEHTSTEWEYVKAKYKQRCAYCDEVKPLTRDHIIPVSKGGTDKIENIQPLCWSCNSRKSTKPDHYARQSAARFKK